MKYAILCAESRTLLKFEIRAIFFCVANESVQKIAFFRRFFSDAMSNDCTRNQRPGDESTHKIAYAIHRSIFVTANTQILGAKDVEICTF